MKSIFIALAVFAVSGVSANCITKYDVNGKPAIKTYHIGETTMVYRPGYSQPKKQGILGMYKYKAQCIVDRLNNRGQWKKVSKSVFYTPN